MHRIVITLALAGPLVLTSGCFKSYKYDVQQGNVIEQERLEKVEPGMSKREIQAIMGTPIIRDSFHANWWDYFYTMKKGRSKQRVTRHVRFHFENDTLVRISGDVEPTGVFADRPSVSETQVIEVTGPRKEKSALKRGWEGLWKRE